MADTNRQLVIEILTKYIGADQAQQVAADLERISPATADVGKETAKTSEEGFKWTGRMREQRILFSELNRLVPGLGESLRGLATMGFNPLIGVALLVGSAIYYAKKELADYNKELDAIGTDAAAAHAVAIQAVHDAWDSVEESMATYFANLQRAAIDKDPTKTFIENLKKLEEIQFNVAKKQIENLGKQEEAAIRYQDALLGKTAKQTEADIAAAKEHTQAKLDALQDQHDAKTAALLDKEKTLKEADLAAANAALDTDTKRMANANAMAMRNDDELKKLRERNAILNQPDLEKMKKEHPEDLRVQIEAAQQNVKAWQKNLDKELDPLAKTMIQGALDAAQAKLADLLRKQNLNQKRQEELEADQQQWLTEKAVADKQLAEDQARAIAAQARITELSGPQGEIAQTQLRNQTEAQGRRETEITEKAGDAFKMVIAAALTQNLNAGQQDLLTMLGSMIAGHNVNLVTAEKMFQTASKSQDVMDNLLNRLLIVMENMGNNLAPFERRLQALEHLSASLPTHG